MTHWLGLEGKVAVVTGAAGGTGKAIAEALAGAGASVAVLDRDEVACADVADGLSAPAALGIGFDAGDSATIAAAAARVVAELGPCDVLLNYAGILRPGGIDTVTPEVWDLVLRINLTGYLACSRAFGAPMLARHAGAIVHVASIAASEPQAFSGAYSASKAAVAMLSRQLAFE
jgi:NAD(P)-dependent dehydrogenase (short-subunit alcohol dehydrogenase family)